MILVVDAAVTDAFAERLDVLGYRSSVRRLG
jgi:hypothetical protein